MLLSFRIIIIKNEDKFTHWVKSEKGRGGGKGKKVEFPLQTKAVHEHIFGILWYHQCD